MRQPFPRSRRLVPSAVQSSLHDRGSRKSRPGTLSGTCDLRCRKREKGKRSGRNGTLLPSPANPTQRESFWVCGCRCPGARRPAEVGWEGKSVLVSERAGEKGGDSGEWLVLDEREVSLPSLVCLCVVMVMAVEAEGWARSCGS